MKKKLLLTLTVLGAFVFAGCKSKKTTKDDSTTKITTKTNTIVKTTKTNVTTKEDVLENMEYEQDKTIRHEYEKDENGNAILIKSASKLNDDTDYKYYAKIEREFNASNQMVKNTSYIFDDDKNDFVADYRTIYTYNIEGEIETETEGYYSEEENDFIFSYKSINTYANGKILSYYVMELIDDELVNSSRYSYTYEGDNVKTQTYEEWSTSTNTWVYREKTVNNYEGDKRISFYDLKWDGSNWVNYAKGEFEYYPTTGMEKSYTYLKWFDEKNNYVPYTRTLYEYSDSGKKEIRISQSYFSEWKNQSKSEITYPYDETTSTCETIRYNYNSSTNNWDKSTKRDFIADKYNNWVYSCEYKWDKTTETWIINDFS